MINNYRGVRYLDSQKIKKTRKLFLREHGSKENIHFSRGFHLLNCNVNDESEKHQEYEVGDE